MSLLIRAPDLGFLKPLCSKAQFFVFYPARKIRDINEKSEKIHCTERKKVIKYEIQKMMPAFKQQVFDYFLGLAFLIPRVESAICFLTELTVSRIST